MTTVDASTSTQSVIFTTTSSQLAFSAQDLGGVNSEFDYSGFTLGGDDMQITGAGIDFANSPPTTGTATDIEIDLGNNSFANPDVLITAITAPGGDAQMTAIVAGAASFFAELMSDDDLMTGSAFTDTIEAGAGDDFLTMGASNDHAFGGDGDDTLNGGTGADTLEGGLNDDAYILDNVGDVVVEAAGAGTDAVQSSVTHTLSANVETLGLSGAAAINGTGNALANLIVGNGAINTLNGGLGADTMEGGAGNDTYVVDNTGDVVVEAAGGGVDLVLASVTHALDPNVENLTLTGGASISGTGNAGGNVIFGNVGSNALFGQGGADTLDGFLGNDVLNGGSGADDMFGGAGNDTLDGGTGVDTMTGGAGNDSYTVDDAGDVIVEAAGAGVDTVTSSVSYSLSADVETLILTGIANINGTGNGIANLIVGNNGNNFLIGGADDDTLNGGIGNDNLFGLADDDVLDGGIGADVMTGDTGDDSYTIDAAADVAVEAAGGGVDTVNASITDVLDVFVENLTLTGAANINGTGNAGDNVLVGNVGLNVLIGGTGADTLAGGGGADELTGGQGLDVYDYDAVTDSSTGAAARDVITFFENPGAAFGDLIDVFGIDADTSTAADDAFTFLGVRQNPFPPITVAGDLWVRNEGGDTVVYGNVDADLAPELAIIITDAGVPPSAYDPADFIL